MIILTNSWYDQNQYPNNQRPSNQPYSRYSRISIEDAMSIATEQIPGEVVKVGLDTENGVLIYEVEIVNAQGIKYEVEIDAQTGSILKMKLD